MSILCPVCSIPLIPRVINGIEIDFCENGCKGVWFDKGEINKINNINHQQKHKDLAEKYIPKNKKEITSEGIRTCPRCLVDLEKINKPKGSNIYIDICKKCKGFWLDQGELSAIHNHFKEHKASNKAFDDSLFSIFVVEALFLLIEVIVDSAIESI